MDFLTIVNNDLSAIMTFEPSDNELVDQTKVIELESFDEITGFVFKTESITLEILSLITYDRSVVLVETIEVLKPNDSTLLV